jgi:hypothetical protein
MISAKEGGRGYVEEQAPACAQSPKGSKPCDVPVSILKMQVKGYYFPSVSRSANGLLSERGGRHCHFGLGVDLTAGLKSHDTPRANHCLQLVSAGLLAEPEDRTYIATFPHGYLQQDPRI